MKRFTIVVLAMVIIGGMFVSCGEKKPDTKPAAEKKSESGRLKTYQIEKVELPEWYYDDGATVKKEEGDDATYIYFLMDRDAATAAKAVKAAKADLKIAVAEAIKNITSTEMIKASEGMLNDKDVMDEYFQETVASISRNTDTGGLIPAGQVVEHLGKKIPNKEKDEEFYRCTLRSKMNYQQFQDKLFKAIEKHADRVNKVLKDDGEKVVNEMKENMAEQSK